MKKTQTKKEKPQAKKEKQIDNKKIVSIIVGAIAFVVAFVGMQQISLNTNNKKYSSNGFSIELPESFYKKDLASATAYFESKDAIVTALKEDYKTLEVVNINKESTIQDYAKAVGNNNKMTINLKDLKNTNYKYFTYEKTNSSKPFYYVGVIVKSNDAFWLINFGCERKNKTKYETKFLDWAKTIKIN